MKTDTKTKEAPKVIQTFKTLPWRKSDKGHQLCTDHKLYWVRGEFFTVIDRLCRRVMLVCLVDSKEAEEAIEEAVLWFKIRPMETGALRDVFYAARMIRDILLDTRPSTVSCARDLILGEEVPSSGTRSGGYLETLLASVLGFTKSERFEAARAALIECEKMLSESEAVDTDKAMALAMVKGALGALDTEE